jgi:hypothetical protein
VHKIIKTLIISIYIFIIGCKKDNTPTNINGTWKLTSYNESYYDSSNKQIRIDQTNLIASNIIGTNASQFKIEGNNLKFGRNICMDSLAITGVPALDKTERLIFTVKNTIPLMLDFTFKTDNPIANNHKFYELQNSEDGIHFCGGYKQTAPISNSETTTAFDFIDTAPRLGESFYRVKVIYNDNSYRYTPQVKVYSKDTYLLLSDKNGLKLEMDVPLWSKYQNFKISRLSSTTIRLFSKASNVYIEGEQREIGELEMIYTLQ